MEYYQLTVFGTLKKDVDYKNSYEEIGKVINHVMGYDNYLKKLHERKGIKFYVFSSFHPTEIDKVYKSGKTYSFQVRSIDGNFIIRLKNCFEIIKNNLLNVNTTDLKVKKVYFIDELYTKTPAVAVIDRKRHWTLNDYSLNVLMDRIRKNTVRKYEEWYKKPVKSNFDFIESIRILNSSPIVIPYKGGIVLSNKMILKIRKDPLSQKLGGIILATGLLEKNSSLGCGFTTFKK